MSHKVCIVSTPVVVKGPDSGIGPERRTPNAQKCPRRAQFGADIAQNAPAAQRRRANATQLRDGASDAPGATAAAAAAWPRAALQRPEAREPAPFVPQRLGPDLLEAPKSVTARPRVVAAACALPAARLPGAEAERSQQFALRAPDQIVAHAQWPRQPLFEREPPRKASRGSSPRHNLSFENALMSFERCPFATCAYPFSRCRYAPEFCLLQEKPSQEASSKKLLP